MSVAAGDVEDLLSSHSLLPLHSRPPPHTPSRASGRSQSQSPSPSQPPSQSQSLRKQSGERIHFSCTMCGECCRSGDNLLLSPHDIYEMTRWEFSGVLLLPCCPAVLLLPC